MRIVVHAANIQDRDGAKLVLNGIGRDFPWLRRIWVDGGYRGKLVAWAEATLGLALSVVRPSAGTTGFQVLNRRWVVERSLAWMGRYRRLSKDYEVLTEVSEAIYAAAFGTTMLKRIARRLAS